MSKAIYWFSNDLRLADNASIARALSRESNVAFVFCFDPKWLSPLNYHCKPLGEVRYQFLLETLQSLDHALRHHGQHLHCFYASAEHVISRLYQEHDVRRVYHSVNAGYDERKMVRRLEKACQNIEFVATHTHTLFQPDQLPFLLEDLPDSFSKFRRRVEPLRQALRQPSPLLSNYGKPALTPLTWQGTLPKIEQRVHPMPGVGRVSQGSDGPVECVDDIVLFRGGEQAGFSHLNRYFASGAATQYKQTRNALDDFSVNVSGEQNKLNGTRFSPWLANGALSARQVWWALEQYENVRGANESTYWIFFELLWREYFQWYAHCHQFKLFTFDGICGSKPLTSFYSARYQSWCQGNTSFPIVNACMKQLNQTGYLSNRGRQLVASCFVNELALDWRYGAAYFEEKLIDYDVASNWGNWQYLAGVGADPRHRSHAGHGVQPRHFNLEKQTQLYDPERAFINRWQGSHGVGVPEHVVDAVDWPVPDLENANAKNKNPPMQGCSTH